jgi:hypothetical protein
MKNPGVAIRSAIVLGQKDRAARLRVIKPYESTSKEMLLSRTRKPPGSDGRTRKPMYACKTPRTKGIHRFRGNFIGLPER